MKFGFMSSVCPPLTLAELIDKAKHYNYEHLELRVEWDHGHGVELDSTPQQLRDARHRFADSGIELSCIATGVRFIDPDAQKRAEQVDLLKRILTCPKRWARRIFGFSGIGCPKLPLRCLRLWIGKRKAFVLVTVSLATPVLRSVWRHTAISSRVT